jgi:serine/threonine protein kinase
MDLVKGLPITEFCDQAKLTIRERLELFLSVCQAVQHAHQKGIIHRDIKPSNVLVTLHDGTPLAKVIDFGIAKALGQELTDKTLYTGFAQVIGTPLYMSPEQAALSKVDVDTRATFIRWACCSTSFSPGRRRSTRSGCSRCGSINSGGSSARTSHPDQARGTVRWGKRRPRSRRCGRVTRSA